MIDIVSIVILFILSPPGFLIVLLLLVYGAYMTLKSIMKSPYEAPHAKIIADTPRQTIPVSLVIDLPLSSSDAQILETVHAHKNIGAKELSDILGISTTAARKSIKGLVDKGYLVRMVNIQDRRAFCYMPADKYYTEGVKSMEE